MINTALYLAFIGFAFSASFTPGPNNFMVMSSGALFGYRRTFPHVLGIALGFNFVMLAAIFGMGAIISQFPWVLTVVKIAGASWLAWLGWKFFLAAFGQNKSTDKTDTKERSRPFRFYEAVLFQWVNPKALIMALAAAGAYVGISDDIIVRTALICGTFLFIGIASASTWAIAGSALNRLMSKGRSALILNTVMGLLLFGTALMILLTKT